MLAKRLTAECLGTLLLVAVVVGSGIMAERLSNGNTALALLANTLATGAGLVALILAFGGISGAHFNPAVSLADAMEGGISWREFSAYVSVQILGGILGTATAHAMFGVRMFVTSQHARSGPPQVFSEFVATFGLLAVIWGSSRVRKSLTPFAVAAYITSAYWFTSSTSFANPAVTIARSLTDTFTGIRPADVPAFIAAQVVGAVSATLLYRWLLPQTAAERQRSAEQVVVPHPLRGASMKKFVFACVHNAGRSQMAAAIFNSMADHSRCRAISAGTQPAEHVHPEVVQAMREVGIDLANSQPQRLTPEVAGGAHLLVTMGYGEACPYVPGLRVVDWALPDPKGQSLESVRELREEISSRVSELMRNECADCCAVV